LSDASDTVEALTDHDETMIQGIVATHLRVRPYYKPLLLLLTLGSVVTTVMFVRLVVRVQGAADALGLSFYDGFRFRLLLGQPLTAKQLDLISAATTLRAAFIAFIVAVAVPFLFAAIHGHQSMVTKLSNARGRKPGSAA